MCVTTPATHPVVSSPVVFDHVLWWHHIGSVTVSPTSNGIKFEQFSGEIIEWPWNKIDSRMSAESNVTLSLKSSSMPHTRGGDSGGGHERVELTFPTVTVREEFDSFVDICRDMNAIDRARNSKRLSFILESASEDDDSDYETDEEETIDLSGRHSIVSSSSKNKGGGADRYSGILANQDPLSSTPVYGRGRSLAQLSLQRHSSHRFITTGIDDDSERGSERRGRTPPTTRTNARTRTSSRSHNNNNNNNIRYQHDVVPIIDDSSIRSNNGNGVRVVEKQNLFYMLFAGCLKSTKLQKQPSFIRRSTTSHTVTSPATSSSYIRPHSRIV